MRPQLPILIGRFCSGLIKLKHLKPPEKEVFCAKKRRNMNKDQEQAYKAEIQKLRNEVAEMRPFVGALNYLLSHKDILIRMDVWIEVHKYLHMRMESRPWDKFEKDLLMPKGGDKNEL